MSGTNGAAPHVGIEALDVYGGCAFLDVELLAGARGLDMSRFRNLLMRRKSVALGVEDPVSFAVNAAKPIVDRLGPETRDRIELLVVATESGLDFGKPISTYVHQYLGLGRHCRTFEVKHACYGGTAALQTALDFVLARIGTGAKALVVTTDVARPLKATYAEPSQGAAAVAMLVGTEPSVLEIEIGRNGVYGYEVMDSCRPTSDIEIGDPDLSLLSYLDCIEHSFAHYARRAGGADFQDDFAYLAFHTPFGGMVKGAHRAMMRKLKRLPPDMVEADFTQRMLPSLRFCREVGNVYSGTVFLALAGALATGDMSTTKRIGLFSYGSGCCSEFYSGLTGRATSDAIAGARIGARLDERHELSMDEYEAAMRLNQATRFGTETLVAEPRELRHVYERTLQDRGLLVLDRIDGYHRTYRWS